MKKIFTLIALALSTLAGHADTVVTTTDATTDGTSFYAMFSATEALDFSAAEGVEAFIAKSITVDREVPGRIVHELKSIGLVPVKQAPANTGLVVRTATAGSFTIPTATADVAAIEGNELVAVATRTDAFDVADMDEETVPFVVGVKNGSFGVIPVADYNDFEENDGWMPEAKFFLEAGTSFLSLDYSLATPTTVVAVTFEEAQEPAATVSVTTLESLTDGTSFYALFSSDKALDFSAAEGVEAFAAKSVYTDRVLPNGRTVTELTGVALVAVQQVPANTGLVVKSSAAGTFDVPEATADVAAIEGNELVAVAERCDASVISFPEDEDAEEFPFPFVLGTHANGTFGFIPAADASDIDDETGWWVEGKYFLEAGTAYLPLDYTLVIPSNVFPLTTNDTATGIANIEHSALNIEHCYDLQGRRVTTMQAKGLYIVGGKKILVK